MKIIIHFFFIAGLMFLVSCRGAENKAAKTNPPEEKKIDTDQTKSAGHIPDNNETKSGKANNPVSRPAEKNSEILSHIDNYLVSSAQFTVSANGGIVDGMVTVQNTLPNITFQKAFVEASILKENGEEYRTDYYTIQNIEPGDSKTVRIPKAAQGVKVVTHIVKVKSDDLTNGEMVLTGSRAIPK